MRNGGWCVKTGRNDREKGRQTGYIGVFYSSSGKGSFCWEGREEMLYFLGKGQVDISVKLMVYYSTECRLQKKKLRGRFIAYE